MMKRNNINAIRSSHYQTPSKRTKISATGYGLYAIDEGRIWSCHGFEWSDIYDRISDDPEWNGLWDWAVRDGGQRLQPSFDHYGR